MHTENTYDAVIVGSGLGGLLTAVILAKEGMKVCVLEKDKQIGGCLQTFSINKKLFDSCVHYIGGLGKGHTLWRIFMYAGIMDKLTLKAFDTKGFDRIAFGTGETLYPQAIGGDNFVEQLLPYFPDEKKSLQQYISTIKNVGDQFPLYYLRKGSAGEKATVSNWPLTQTLQGITSNTLLQQVLAGNNLLYAGMADSSPFYMHALVLDSYIHSAHKIVPGSSQIAKLLWYQLQAHGGVIHRNTEVKKLTEENGQITYAESINGERFYGKHFISGIHPAALLKMVDSSLLRPIYRNRINGLAQTTSAFMLNLVLKPGTVPILHYNLYWHATHDVWAAIKYTPASWPASYALYFTEDAANPGFADTLAVLTYMHYEEVAQWADTNNRQGDEHQRGESYDHFKAQRSETLLQKVYERVPQLKDNITAQSAATPLTYRDYTATPEGALYGILKDVNKPETAISTRTRISNLLLTGQNVNLHGVLGVSITAIVTCAELLGIEYLLGKLNATT